MSAFVTDITDQDKPRKIAIVGYTFTHRDAPWDNPEWKIWGMNNLHRWINNADWGGWVDIHDDKTLDEDKEHLEWLKQEHPFPIWMFNPRPEFPSAIPFPKEMLKERWAKFADKGQYFTNTVSWMVALAISEVEWAIGDGAEIGIWGVDMATGDKGGGEYSFQRPSCELWVGRAEGMGINLTIADASDLLKTANVYGEEDNPIRTKMLNRQAEMQERREAILKELDLVRNRGRELEGALLQIKGSDETMEYFLGAWFTPENKGQHGRASNDPRSTETG